MLKSRYLFLLLAAVLLGLWYWAGRSAGKAAAYDRPNDPWVFRSVLDQQPRMITLALNEKMWVAYSTDSCSMYKAWSGAVAFEGAVYNMRHGPQPTTVGSAWFENKYRRPWQVTVNGKTETPATDYKGHRYTEDGHAEIMYDLVLSDGRRIRINERPEYVEVDRQIGLERVFRIENAPADAVIALQYNTGSIAGVSAIQTNGNWKTNAGEPLITEDGLQTVIADGVLTLRKDGDTKLTTMFVRRPLFKNPNAATPEEEEGPVLSPGEKLIAKSDCRTCHNAAVKTVGPAYVDIAERYLNTPANVEMLAQKVMAGGAGVWGVAAMSAHPDLQPVDAEAMVNYILSLDEGEDDGEGATVKAKDLAAIPASEWLVADPQMEKIPSAPGLLVKVFNLPGNPETLDKVNFKAKPVAEAIAGTVDAGAEEFGDLKENFAIEASGYLFLEKDDNVLFQIGSDDGSRVYLDGKLLIDNDGLHGMDGKEAEVALRAGYHPIRIEYFQGGGGRGIQLKWARSGDPAMKIIPQAHFSHKQEGSPADLPLMTGSKVGIPGDGMALKELHPSFDLSQARPEEFLPKVAGMDFLSDGRLVVSTWDAMGGIYILSNVQSGDPKKIKVRQIAKGLAEPLGLKVVDDTIYVLQKQELTKLIDLNGDEIIDEYQCFAKGWLASANFHEFAFGLVYKDEHFYAALAIAILPGGASARPQIPDRGKVVKISRKDGSIEFVARGLRTPDGVGIGPDGEIFIADNQGDWLPSSKILHVKPGAFFGSYAVDSPAVAGMTVQLPVVWLPQDEIGNSPTQPAVINVGPYKNQLLHGDVCYGGLQRVFMEKVNGFYQGCVFRFTQGLEAGTHRLAWGPDGALYVGGIGNPGNWGQQDKLWYGLQRMKYNGKSTFEMLAVRAKNNGLEIEFTEPLREGDGWDPAHYLVKQWWYEPTVNYGGPKMDEENLAVQSASVSNDRRKVFLEIPGVKENHVVYLRLRNLPLSEAGHEIWTTEAWYTMNYIPSGALGEVKPRPAFSPAQDNALSARELKDGWKLLFDGRSMKGWHNYGKKTVGTSWKVQDGAICLEAQPNPSGHWQAADGGDILTDAEYENFEFTLDWKISPCGNSGIFYNVTEDPKKYDYGWMTGPEMQILDNTCHPDARIPKHRAGDLYDMIECKYVTVKPAGQWNRARIVSKNGRVEHWLNDRKLVEFDMNSPEWPKMIAASKFREWAGFGAARKGRIALQDHGNPVWFKNVKIRKL
jgi:cytochrome c